MKLFLVKHFKYFNNFRRTLYYTKDWPKNFNYDVAKNIEGYWRPVLDEHQKSYENSNEIKDHLPKKYILSMFPYPSGRLHLGHVRVYTLSDVLARYYRMNGYNVIHPIGWDSFGLPAENAAIERNLKPDIWTKDNIAYMKNQLKELSFSFDWNRELSTCDKSYYKMTQHLFLEMFHKGFVFQKEALVNWDPVDKTVLANEQIDENGRSWRSGSLVEKKALRQWFIKSSAFAKSLSDSLNDLNTSDWELVKTIQGMWIGNINGCLIDFEIKFEDSKKSDTVLSVFTQSPFAIYGISHISVTKNNLLLKYLNIENASPYERLKCYAINPLNNAQKIPIYLNIDQTYFGTLNGHGVPYVDSKIAFPSLDENDKEFAVRNGLSFNEILNPENHKLINSNKLDNLTKEEASNLVKKSLIQLNRGGFDTSDRLSDWCISRQRYWGTPIPLVYCEKCKVVPIPFEELPVELPLLEEKYDSWLDTTCPKCKGPAKRESDTMDTFMDSSWYYLRYLDVNNTHEPYESKKAFKNMPVDVYIGGIEHAMTQLISHFLYDQNKLPCKEPFQRFISMGMVKGETYKTKQGKYVPSAEVIEKENKYYEKGTNEPLSKDFEKMSKSKLNGVDPQLMIQTYGIDFTRFFMLSFVHPRSERNFSLANDMVSGTLNTFKTLWSIIGSASKCVKANETDAKLASKYEKEIYTIRNTQLSMLTYNLIDNFNLPSYLVAISKIIKGLKKIPANYQNEKYYVLLVETLILLTPVIPHFTSECWSKLKLNLPTNKFDKDKDIVDLKWPQLDDDWQAVVNIKLNAKSFLNFNLNHKDIKDLTIEKVIQIIESDDEMLKKFKSKINRPINEYKISLRLRQHVNAVMIINEKRTENINNENQADQQAKQDDDF